MPSDAIRPWLLLIHAIPPKPEYLRVKVARRLARVGAVPVKNSVYVLPRRDESLEDFQWVLREVVAGGGECTVCEATFVGGLTDDGVMQLFRAARDRDYAPVIDAAERLRTSLTEQQRDDQSRAQAASEIAKLRRRCAEIAGIDFFRAEAGPRAEAALHAVESILDDWGRATRRDATEPLSAATRGRTWVTRRGIKVDRIASAWLIRRFIDPDARFVFVDPSGFSPRPGELRFDMFDAEYTHEGPRCTFETLVHRFGLDQPALSVVGEIVHDIDFKENVFGRDETAGIARLIDGLAATIDDDELRLQHGCTVFDALYASLSAASSV